MTKTISGLFASIILLTSLNLSAEPEKSFSRAELKKLVQTLNLIGGDDWNDGGDTYGEILKISVVGTSLRLNLRMNFATYIGKRDIKETYSCGLAGFSSKESVFAGSGNEISDQMYSAVSNCLENCADDFLVKHKNK